MHMLLLFPGFTSLAFLFSSSSPRCRIYYSTESDSSSFQFTHTPPAPPFLCPCISPTLPAPYLQGSALPASELSITSSGHRRSYYYQYSVIEPLLTYLRRRSMAEG